MSANDSGDASASSSSPATAATTAAAAVRRDERQNNAGKTNNNSSNVVAGANALQNVSGTTASTRAGSPSTVAGGSGDARDDRHTRGGAHGKKNAQSISRTSTPRLSSTHADDTETSATVVGEVTDVSARTGAPGEAVAGVQASAEQNGRAKGFGRAAAPANSFGPSAAAASGRSYASVTAGSAAQHAADDDEDDAHSLAESLHRLATPQGLTHFVVTPLKRDKPLAELVRLCDSNAFLKRNLHVVQSLQVTQGTSWRVAVPARLGGVSGEKALRDRCRSDWRLTRVHSNVQAELLRGTRRGNEQRVYLPLPPHVPATTAASMLAALTKRTVPHCAQFSDETLRELSVDSVEAFARVATCVLEQPLNDDEWAALEDASVELWSESAWRRRARCKNCSSTRPSPNVRSPLWTTGGSSTF